MRFPKKIGPVVLLGVNKPSVCSQCGETAETRAYGVDGAEVCFSCGTGSEEAVAVAKEAFKVKVGM